MPANDGSLGAITFAVQHVFRPDGSCPRFAGDLGSARGFRQFGQWLAALPAG